jgi:hypothetical protein
LTGKRFSQGILVANIVRVRSNEDHGEEQDGHNDDGHKLELLPALAVRSTGHRFGTPADGHFFIIDSSVLVATIDAVKSIIVEVGTETVTAIHARFFHQMKGAVGESIVEFLSSLDSAVFIVVETNDNAIVRTTLRSRVVLKAIFFDCLLAFEVLRFVGTSTVGTEASTLIGTGGAVEVLVVVDCLFSFSFIFQPTTAVSRACIAHSLNISGACVNEFIEIGDVFRREIT